MPELPEVETVVREIRPGLVGENFSALEVSRQSLRRRWSPAWAKQLVGAKVAKVERRGKWILVDLGGPQLVIHLGMTGQLVVMPAELPVEPHTHMIITLGTGTSQLRFRDVRRFGSITLFADRAELDRFFDESGLGPEPFEVPQDYWSECLARTKRNLKAILLDQRVLAGVGNIYADESLFAAKLHPGRLGNSLSKREANALRKAVGKVLTRAIERRGSSIRNYIGGSGLKGSFQDEFCVYGRTKQPCPRCGAPIARMVLAGRSTHYCPACQQADGHTPDGFAARDAHERR